MENIILIVVRSHIFKTVKISRVFKNCSWWATFLWKMENYDTNLNKIIKKIQNSLDYKLPL
jgi:hypothetical protein